MRAILLAGLMLAPVPALSETFDLSYLAAIGAQDLFSSRGVRLESAAQVLRQDRANFHRFNVRQPQDEWDPVLDDSDLRAAFEDALKAAAIDPETEAAVLAGRKLVLVELRSNTGGFDYARVVVPGETP